jgi:hypothetical protein
MLAVTLLLERDLDLGTPGMSARGRRFVTDRHGPAVMNRAISADLVTPIRLLGSHEYHSELAVVLLGNLPMAGRTKVSRAALLGRSGRWCWRPHDTDAGASSLCQLPAVGKFS